MSQAKTALIAYLVASITTVPVTAAHAQVQVDSGSLKLPIEGSIADEALRARKANLLMEYFVTETIIAAVEAKIADIEAGHFDYNGNQISIPYVPLLLTGGGTYLGYKSTKGLIKWMRENGPVAQELENFHANRSVAKTLRLALAKTPEIAVESRADLLKKLAYYNNDLSKKIMPRLAVKSVRGGVVMALRTTPIVLGAVTALVSGTYMLVGEYFISVELMNDIRSERELMIYHLDELSAELKKLEGVRI